MTNILFAPDNVNVTMIASPVTKGEGFFEVVAKHGKLGFRTVYGVIPASARNTDTIDRSANFEVPLKDLSELYGAP